jgi:uncharacterized Zn finger protein (UPF0148 family)
MSYYCPHCEDEIVDSCHHRLKATTPKPTLDERKYKVEPIVWTIMHPDEGGPIEVMSKDVHDEAITEMQAKIERLQRLFDDAYVLLKTRDAEILQLRETLGMVDAVGIPESYDKIVREALEKK